MNLIPWTHFHDFTVQLAIAFALCVDAFSAAMAMGYARLGLRKRFIFSISVGIFHFALPFIASKIGIWGSLLVGWYAPLLSGILFTTLGIQMVILALKDQNDVIGMLSNFKVFLFALMVSADALTAGFSIGLIRSLHVFDVICFGGIAFLVSLIGWWLGQKIPHGNSKWASFTSGIIFFYFGIQHLLEWI